MLLGDIALGPMPAETLDVLAGLGERAVLSHCSDTEALAAFTEIARQQEGRAS